MNPELDHADHYKRSANLRHFLYARENAHRDISKVATKALLDRLRWFVERVVTAAELPTPPVFGWSGGKESAVLEYVLRPFGWRSVCVLTQLELPISEKFISRALPKNFTVATTRHDVAWLKVNDEYLFPREPEQINKWRKITVFDTLEDYAKTFNAGMMITGRRRTTGDKVPGIIAVGERQVKNFAPLLDLTTSEIWAMMRHFDLPEHPLYELAPSSLVRGTGGWPMLTSWETMRGVDREFCAEMRTYFA